MRLTEADDRERWTGRDTAALLLVLGLALAVRLAARPLLAGPNLVFWKYPTLGAEFLDGTGPATGAFTASPLYLYFWYLLHIFFHGTLAGPLVIQLVEGAVCCALVGLAGRLLLARPAGWLAGLAAAVYAPLVANDASFVSEGLVLFVNTAGLVCLLLAQRDRSAGPAAAAGICFGLSGAARPNILLFLPFAAAALWLVPDLDRRRRAGLVAAFSLFALLGPAVITWRNQRVSGDPVLVMSDSGIVFYLGNNELDTGLSYVWPRFEDLFATLPGEVDPTHRIAREIAEAELGRTLSPNECADYWLGAGLAFVRGHPGEYLRLLGRKLRYFWSACEPHDVQTTFEQERLLRRWPLLGWLAVAPLGLLGLLVTARDWRRWLPLHGLLVTYTATGLLFTVVTRYRLPMVPAVMLLAAAGWAWLADRLAARERRRLVLGLAAVALITAGLGHQDFPMRSLEADYAASGRLVNRAEAALDAGDLDRAAELYQRIVDERPTFAQVVGARRALAVIAARRGDLAEAQRQSALSYGPLLPDRLPADLPSLEACEARLRADPDDLDARLALGALAWQAGDAAAAERWFHQVALAVPSFAAAHANRAVCLRALDRLGEARRWATAARLKNPNLPGIHRLLAELAAEQQDLPALLAELDHAVGAHPAQLGFRYGLGEALLAAGRRGEAREAFESVWRVAPSHPEARARLAELTGAAP